MKNLSFFLLSALLSCGLVNSVEAFNSPSSISYTHTAELRPIHNSFQIAKTTFLPDRFDDLGMSDYNTLKNNYNSSNCDDYPLSSCPSGSLCQACPFNAKKYRTYTCRAPYSLVNGNCTCPAAVSLNNTNDTCTQYCGNTCIKKSCTPSANQTGCTNGTKSCDNGCGENTRQCCVGCTNKVTYKPANSTYTYADCYDGSDKQIQSGWECNEGYHRYKNSSYFCEKDCVENKCSGFSYLSCPEYAECLSCTRMTTECFNEGTRFAIIKDKRLISKTCDTIGDILYSNKTCAAYPDYLHPSLEVIGFVIDPEKRYYVDNSSFKQREWWLDSFIKFPETYGSYLDISGLKNMTYDEAIQDFDGEKNTQIIIAAKKEALQLPFPPELLILGNPQIAADAASPYLLSAGELYKIINGFSRFNQGRGVYYYANKLGMNKFNNLYYIASSTEAESEIDEEGNIKYMFWGSMGLFSLKKIDKEDSFAGHSTYVMSFKTY